MGVDSSYADNRRAISFGRVKSASVHQEVSATGMLGAPGGKFLCITATTKLDRACKHVSGHVFPELLVLGYRVRFETANVDVCAFAFSSSKIPAHQC